MRYPGRRGIGIADLSSLRRHKPAAAEGGGGIELAA